MCGGRVRGPILSPLYDIGKCFLAKIRFTTDITSCVDLLSKCDGRCYSVNMSVLLVDE